MDEDEKIVEAIWRRWFAWHPVDIADRYHDGRSRDDSLPKKTAWLRVIERKQVEGRWFPFFVYRDPYSGETR